MLLPKIISNNKFSLYRGNVLDILRNFKDNSIDCIITSPPYFQLRLYENIPDYIWGGDNNCYHEFNDNNFCIWCPAWKGQLGQEPFFQMFINNLIAIFAECKRVLKREGTIFVNIADTFNTVSGGLRYANTGKLKYRKQILQTSQELPKQSLMLIPHRFAIACQEKLKLIQRNTIVWGKPNALPEAVGNRFSKKHEYIFFFTKSKEYYFNLDAIRDETSEAHKKRCLYAFNGNKKQKGYVRGDKSHLLTQGKNPGDCSDLWFINKGGSKENHFASYSEKLISKPILAGCPENGIVLDIFCGTGTTGSFCLKNNRKFIGIDGSSEYIEMSYNNLKKYLTN